MSNFERPKTYLFTSERLGFQKWQDSDIQPMAELNTDEEVMYFFPGLVSLEQTVAFIDKMNAQFQESGFCYFAVDYLATGEFIGFIGLDRKTFESEFTPCIDLDWRLAKKYWNCGFATEGALRCVRHAFEDLLLTELCAMAPLINLPSIKVMEKIGMQKAAQFKHPLLINNPRLIDCALYKITRS